MEVRRDEEEWNRKGVIDISTQGTDPGV